MLTSIIVLSVGMVKKLISGGVFMKKQGVFKALVTMVLALAIVAGAFVFYSKQVSAADLFYEATVKSKALKSAKANMTLYVNGTKLSKKGFTVYGEIKGREESIIYLPAKALATAAGLTYKENGKKVTITAGNVQLKFTRGKNSYVFTVTNADGSKDKVTYKYGISCKKSKQVYVPCDIVVRFSELLNLDFDCSLEGKKFSITLLPGGKKDDVGDSDQSVSADEYEAALQYIEELVTEHPPVTKQNLYECMIEDGFDKNVAVKALEASFVELDEQGVRAAIASDRQLSVFLDTEDLIQEYIARYMDELTIIDVAVP